jgi:hypothetical protein
MIAPRIFWCATGERNGETARPQRRTQSSAAGGGERLQYVE